MRLRDNGRLEEFREFLCDFVDRSHQYRGQTIHEITRKLTKEHELIHDSVENGPIARDHL